MYSFTHVEKADANLLYCSCWHNYLFCACHIFLSGKCKKIYFTRLSKVLSKVLLATWNEIASTCHFYLAYHESYLRLSALCRKWYSTAPAKIDGRSGAEIMCNFHWEQRGFSHLYTHVVDLISCKIAGDLSHIICPEHNFWTSPLQNC